MTNRMMAGLNRVQRGCARVGMAFMVALAIANSARAQTAVMPPGAGTEAYPYQISQLGHLVWMGNNTHTSFGMYYTLQNNIDATATSGWNSGYGFAPIGSDSYPFMGTFNGNGKVISGLSINTYGGNKGLFGYVGSSGVVKNLGLAPFWVTGSYGVGGLVGYNDGGTVSGCYASGSATGRGHVGGLVGNNGGTVSGCYASGLAHGDGGSYDWSTVGGLVGYNGGTVSGCYATGTAQVEGDGDIWEYSTVGGLVGYNGGMVSGCYATGAAQGRGEYVHVGGLVGYNGGTVSGCYATGTGAAAAGYNNCVVGGLMGGNGGTESNSYWDTQTSGLSNSAGGTGKTTAEMKQQATFAGWNFVEVWSITENVTYPLLAPPAKIIGLSGSLWFGNVVTGKTATRTLTITNSGNRALTVHSITYPARFSGAWSGTIPAKSSQVVTVTFSPLTAKSYSGTVTVNSDKTSGGNMVSASGKGVLSGQIRFSASAYPAQEGASVKILVQRINGSGGSVAANYWIKPGTALAWKDYTSKSGTLIWLNGQTASKVIKIAIPADSKTEGNETFQILLKNPVGTSLTAPSKATITILGNSK